MLFHTNTSLFDFPFIHLLLIFNGSVQFILTAAFEHSHDISCQVLRESEEQFCNTLIPEN